MQSLFQSIWRSNKRTTSELHQTIWHFLQVLTHCNYHQFHKSPGLHWIAHHAKWKMILGQSDHLLSRIRNIEIHFILFLEILFLSLLSLTKPIKMLRLWSHCWDFIGMCFGSFIGKLFIDLKYFFYFTSSHAHEPLIYLGSNIFLIRYICYSFTAIQIKVPKT